MSKLTESIKPTVQNILWNAGYECTRVAGDDFKRTVNDPGAWVETQNYYVTLHSGEWWYQKPQHGNADDICIFGDYSPAGLDKLRKVVKIDPTESE